MVQNIYVGLDVHARTVVASARHGDTGEMWERYFPADNELVTEWVCSLPGVPQVVYEAGPTGYGLARTLITRGVHCVVAAPSKLLPAPGNKVKTDIRDARHLSTLLSVGAVTAVRIPTVDEEIARDLSRAREDARQDLTRAKHRVSKLFLRHGVTWDKDSAWTKQHVGWLARYRFGDPVLDMVVDTMVGQVLEALQRRDQLDKQIHEYAMNSVWTPVVIALGCLRGVSVITGFGLATEIGEWTRFSATSIGAYVGLIPSEHSSGESRHHGGITKTGNGHARILLVESAWHHRPTYRRTSPVLQKRWAKAPQRLVEHGHHANTRLHRMWVGFDKRGKNTALANAAVARELAGFCWDLATMTGEPS